MKKTLQIFSYLIALLVLTLPQQFAWNSTLSAVSLCMILSILIVPFVSLRQPSRFLRGVLSVFAGFCFSVGIPTAFVLGGQYAALSLLVLGTLAVGILRVWCMLPTSVPDLSHLLLRGLRPSHATRKLLLKQSFAFLFRSFGFLSFLPTVWCLLLGGASSDTALYSCALFSVLLGCGGMLLYLILGAPSPEAPAFIPRKSRSVLCILFSIFFVFIGVYIYIGHAYVTPDLGISAALTLVRLVLTPALLGAAAAFLFGMLLGLFLSLFVGRFSGMLARSVLCVPLPLVSVLIYRYFSACPFAVSLSVGLPLCALSLLVMLESRAAIRPFRQFPPAGRKKAILWPLFHRIHLALLPRMITVGLISSLAVQQMYGGMLSTDSAQTLLLAFCILAVMISILYGLCFMVKEARHHG